MELGKINELIYLLTSLSIVKNKQRNQAKTKILKERNLVVLLNICIMMAQGTEGVFSDEISKEIQLTFY